MALTTLQRTVLLIWIREQLSESTQGGSQDHAQTIRAAIEMDEPTLITQIEAYRAVLLNRLNDRLEQANNSATNIQGQIDQLTGG